MQHRAAVQAPRWPAALAGLLCAAAALYALGGVFIAGSLLTGERALRNGNFWGSVFLLGLFASVLLFAVAARVTLGRAARLVGAVVFGAIGVAAFWRVVRHELAVDQCLDRGGSFNYAQSVCDAAANHPSMSLAVTHGFLLTLSCLACLAALFFLRAARLTRRSEPGAL